MTHELESIYRAILIRAMNVANLHCLARMCLFGSLFFQWLPVFSGGSPGFHFGLVAILAFGIHKKTTYIRDTFTAPVSVQMLWSIYDPPIAVKPVERYEQIPQITRSLSPWPLNRELDEREYLLLNEALRPAYLQDAKSCVASELEQNGALSYAVFCRVVLYIAAKELWLSNEERKRNARMAINEMLQPIGPREPVKEAEVVQPTRNWRRVSINAEPSKECADES